MAPNYFQAREHVEQEEQGKSNAEDPAMLERARSYEAARRTELALQYIIDLSDFCRHTSASYSFPFYTSLFSHPFSFTNRGEREGLSLDSYCHLQSGHAHYYECIFICIILSQNSK